MNLPLEADVVQRLSCSRALDKNTKVLLMFDLKSRPGCAWNSLSRVTITSRLHDVTILVAVVVMRSVHSKFMLLPVLCVNGN